MESNDRGLVCSWCNEEVESVSMPDHPGEKPMGKCEDDGLVYVELPDGSENEA